MVKKAVLLILAITCIISCSSSNDDNPEDAVTSITMKIDGVPHTFQALGRGIDLMEDGSYKLHLNFGKYVTSPYQEQSIVIIMKYKKKGKNVIPEFIYHRYVDGVSFDGNFVEGDFESNVSVNSNKRFKATASGSLTLGGQTVTISELKINYVYEDPFD
ncbi:hypothetical protein [Flavobacterium sp.]